MNSLTLRRTGAPELFLLAERRLVPAHPVIGLTFFRSHSE
jgi:hypothetical protein